MWWLQRRLCRWQRSLLWWRSWQREGWSCALAWVTVWVRQVGNPRGCWSSCEQQAGVEQIRAMSAVKTQFSAAVAALASDRLMLANSMPCNQLKPHLLLLKKCACHIPAPQALAQACRAHPLNAAQRCRHALGLLLLLLPRLMARLLAPSPRHGQPRGAEPRLSKHARCVRCCSEARMAQLQLCCRAGTVSMRTSRAGAVRG